jgi:hypothetical protein
MTDEEIIQASKLDGIAGMTVNERLFASGLMKEFDKAMKSDRVKAQKILELLKVDKLSIDKIVE